MPIRVYDYQHDIENLEVHPEIRARFLRIEPGPAGGLHSHDLGGEIFLVLEGHCEFLVEDERVTCGPGQLIYVEPRRKHTLHAVGAAPCVVYLSVTPHVEPTHTFYDGAGAELPPRYGSWRGQGDATPSPDAATAEVARRYASEVRRLAALAQAHAETLDCQVEALAEATAAGDSPAAKRSMDGMWLGLRAVLRCASAAELAWNALAPRAMPAE
jgi:quercetin dioxygenase-like cupin family protein